MGNAPTRATPPPGRLRFGIFEADLATGELAKQGRKVRLQEQPFQLLAILLERPGQLVTREELRLRLWPQTTVDFDHGVNKAISKLREALGDSATNPRFIETVARRGYRLLADVAVVDAETPPRPATEIARPAPSRVVANALPPTAVQGEFEGEATAPSTRRRPSVLVWGLATSASALAILGAMSLLHPPRRAQAAIRSLAVLPLSELSRDPAQDYFADGMTEELITTLGQIRNLRVISRTSVMGYKNAGRPLAEIARELNVEAVIEGSVLRVGDQVRITAHLIAAPADRDIWSHSYEGSVRDALKLQGEVASDIARQIEAALDPQERLMPTQPREVDPRAYESYLRGRYFWNKRTSDGLRKAITSFDEAVELDPDFAKAYAGLADAYALAGDWEYGILAPQDGFARARSAAHAALALDDGLGEAHASLAFASDLYGWDWDTAGREYLRALKLNPGYATAHQWYAWHLIVLGHTGDGISELRIAKSLDPLSLIISADLADALAIDHRYDESIAESRRTLELEPNFGIAHYELGQALTQQRTYGAAITEFHRAIDLSGHIGAFDANLAYALAVSGNAAEATKIVHGLTTLDSHNASAAANIALVYVGLGDREQAMFWLNKAYEARFNPSILRRPAWDSLRTETQFKSLLRRIGLRD